MAPIVQSPEACGCMEESDRYMYGFGINQIQFMYN